MAKKDVDRYLELKSQAAQIEAEMDIIKEKIRSAAEMTGQTVFPGSGDEGLLVCPQTVTLVDIAKVFKALKKAGRDPLEYMSVQITPTREVLGDGLFQSHTTNPYGKVRVTKIV